ncbi:hypothetical protein BFS06_14115 [Clostridium perfringens]|uniref:hypothetical protein n=1 Tax=Clostridium perfringens TaxID=1502 RepID=UPI00103E09DC|nr:hypothetical protein [Clostridium perfringens]TBX14342.1 hypothetical protein BFS06_14115 [Clostridium perfringens]
MEKIIKSTVNDILIKVDKNFCKFNNNNISKQNDKLSKTVENILISVIDTLKFNILNYGKRDILTFLYSNYAFLESNIRSLIEFREGVTNSNIKTKNILEEYEFFIQCEYIAKTPQKYNDNIFNFGTYQLWFEFCEALYKLYYGDSISYFKIYDELIKSDLRIK